MKARLTSPIQLRVYEESPDVAYVELADYPRGERAGCVKRTVRVDHIIPGYAGPDINIDFDANGIAIGIEILYPHGYLRDEPQE